ncbi:cytochrome C biogenesis protein CcdA [Paraoerskovia sediminicola]|uniref:Cytochrome C biogenesis protein CcdA n=1 Tax=Paraoerskovia sediminicola TaxID=1138587 RepID=A0ABM8FZP4_9CELL|nr:cytochrome c biogenesis CcdA family protein [Paraoerskovia sediminicola]BDZ41303.1 cytochrome C biogenesis protein CcdA [Paraoerskovia sediminicola]
MGGDLAATAYSGNLLLALPVALLAGLVSFASPCVLPLVPGYLGLLSGMAGATAGPAGQGRTAAPGSGGPVPSVGTAAASATASAAASVAPSAAPVGGPPAATGILPDTRSARRRVLLGVALFVAGFAVVFVTLTVVAGAIGSQLLAHQDVILRVLGVVVIAMGLVFMGAFGFMQRERRLHVAPRAGLWGAPVLGFVFGLGWAPCIGPTLAAVMALSLDGGSPARGAVLGLAYSIGLGLPFLAIALGLESSTRMVAFMRRHRVVIMRTGGALLVVLGVLLVSGVWQAWSAQIAGWVGGFEPVI